MKSWKGQELGYEAMQPGDSRTMLRGGKTVGGDMGLPSSANDPVDIDKTEDYRLPVMDVQVSRRNFEGVKDKVAYTLEELSDNTLEGVTEYWHDSLSALKNPR